MIALRTFVFTVFVPGTVTVLVPARILAGRSEASVVPWPAAALGALLVAAGLALYLWSAGAFTMLGRGTPAPWDAPREFVAHGPYRFVRNPMYVGVLAVLLGESLFFGATSLALYALLMWFAFHVFVVAYEEPTLRARFGTTYDDYRARVHRWLPAVPP